MKKIISLGFILSLIILVYFLFKKLQIKEIRCKSQYGFCPLKIENDLKNLEGKSFSEIKQSLKNYFQDEVSVEKYSYQFRLPDKLEVSVIQKKASYAIQSEAENNYFLISKEGWVISSQRFTDLPTLKVGKFNKDNGEQVEDEALFSLRLLQAMHKLFEVKVGEYDGKSLRVKINNGPLIIFPVRGDEKVLVGSCRLIVEELNTLEQNSRIESGLAKITIDLRYKNPVIKKHE